MELTRRDTLALGAGAAATGFRQNPHLGGHFGQIRGHTGCPPIPIIPIFFLKI